MSSLSKEIDEMLEKFGSKPDPRLAAISHEEFQKSIEEMDRQLEKEFQEIDRKRAESFREALREGIIY
ncbi:MAG: hypothetical protein K2N20_01980 [Helicobacter sp.]|nr:hypothetical protein [Helicobacter sp.]